MHVSGSGVSLKPRLHLVCRFRASPKEATEPKRAVGARLTVAEIALTSEGYIISVCASLVYHYCDQHNNAGNDDADDENIASQSCGMYDSFSDILLLTDYVY